MVEIFLKRFASKISAIYLFTILGIVRMIKSCFYTTKATLLGGSNS